MAAIYSGIHLKLKNPRTPWADKLKLARFAWISNQCLLPNKEQVLFDWTSHALACFYNKKVEVPLEVVEGLWIYIDDILHSKKLRNMLSQGKTINLRPTLAQMINERILERTSGLASVGLHTVLSCCSGILTSPVLSVTYTANYELLVELLAGLCGLSSAQLKQQKGEEPLSVKIFEAFLLVLSTYLNVQKQQANSNRVFSHVTANLLQPLLLLRHLLNTRVWTNQDDIRIRQNLSKEIRSKVDAILQSALFTSDHLASYREEVLPLEDDAGHKRSHSGKGFLGPVDKILSNLCVEGDSAEQQVLFYAVKSNSLPLLFKFTLDSYCKGPENKLVGFHLMTKLVTALGFTDEMEIEQTFSASNWSLTLLAVENILNSCLTYDIYNVAVDKIRHKDLQFNFYRKLARLLFNNTQMGIPAWYRCLKSLLSLNHHILEPDLDELLSAVWVDADDTELRVKKAREALVSGVLQTYGKLRQLPKLFEELVDVICQPAVDELRPALLPETIQRSLSQCLLDTPASQNLEICWLILKRMQRYLLPHIQEEMGDVALKTFSLSLLLNAVLFSFKTLENSTPVPVVKQTQNLMEEMLNVVKDLLELFEKNLVGQGPGRAQIQNVSLLLTHTWAEVETLFKIHCFRYMSPSDLPNENSTSLVERALQLKDSEDQVPNPLGKILQKRIALYKLKMHMLKACTVSDTETKKNRSVLQETAKFIVSSEELATTPSTDQIWDLQLCTIDVDTYMTAHWFLISSNLPLIAPHLDQKEIFDLAGIVLTSLLQSFHASGNTLENTRVSVSSMSRELLKTQVLCELPEMYSALIKCTIKTFIELLNPSDVKSICSSFFKPYTETSLEEGESNMTPAIKRLKVIGQEILESVKMRSLIPLSKMQMDSFLSLLKATEFLNGFAMSYEDYCDLFLNLFMMTVCVQCDESVSLSHSTELLGGLFNVLTKLLLVPNSTTILKIVYGSSLLEAAMTSLNTRCSKGYFSGVDEPTWVSFLQSVQDFLQSLIQLIIDRRRNTYLNLEKFTSFMVESYGDLSREVEGESCSLQLHLVTLSTLCKEMIATLGKSKELVGTFTHLLEKAISVMQPVIQVVLTGKGKGFLRQTFSVEVVTVMLKGELVRVCHLVQNSSEEDGRVKLSNMSFYRSFFQQILKELYPSPRPMDFLISSVNYLAAFYTAARKTKSEDLDELHVKILRSIHALLSGSWMSLPEVKELEGPVKELLYELVSECSEEQFHVILLMLRESLVVSKVESHHAEIRSAVTLTKLLASCVSPEHCSKAFWLIAPQFISTLIFVVKESSKLPPLTRALTIPTLDTLIVLLRQGEKHLTNPHHVITVLGALQFVPLESQSMEDYHAAFESIHEVLFAMIFCYPMTMLKALPVFMNCFYRLVSSIMYEGRQKGETDKEKDKESLLKCAMLVERMYTHIGSVTEDFTLMSSFMVAQYVTALQRVTLQPEIKAHLTEGIYYILDRCAEKDIKFLNTTLQTGVKEVLRELYSSYTHYHKAQRQGEEKYTV